jgi:hypothetical protein
MLVANNSFDDIDWWVFDISQSSGYSGSIDGLTIENNAVSQRSAKVYAIEVTLPSSVTLDNNDAYNTGGTIASVAGHGDTSSFATFQSWTGQEQHGLSVNPLYANPAGHDYHLQAGSPVINRGRQIPGVTDGFLGSAPDLGRYEEG